MPSADAAFQLLACALGWTLAGRTARAGFLANQAAHALARRPAGDVVEAGPSAPLADRGGGTDELEEVDELVDTAVAAAEAVGWDEEKQSSTRPAVVISVLGLQLQLCFLSGEDEQPAERALGIPQGTHSSSRWAQVRRRLADAALLGTLAWLGGTTEWARLWGVKRELAMSTVAPVLLLVVAPSAAQILGWSRFYAAVDKTGAAQWPGMPITHRHLALVGISLLGWYHQFFTPTPSRTVLTLLTFANAFAFAQTHACFTLNGDALPCNAHRKAGSLWTAVRRVLWAQAVLGAFAACIWFGVVRRLGEDDDSDGGAAPLSPESEAQVSTDASLALTNHVARLSACVLGAYAGQIGLVLSMLYRIDLHLHPPLPPAPDAPFAPAPIAPLAVAQEQPSGRRLVVLPSFRAAVADVIRLRRGRAPWVYINVFSRLEQYTDLSTVVLCAVTFVGHRVFYECVWRLWLKVPPSAFPDASPLLLTDFSGLALALSLACWPALALVGAAAADRGELGELWGWRERWAGSGEQEQEQEQEKGEGKA